MPVPVSRANASQPDRVPDRVSEQRSTILAAAISILHERGAGALTVRSVATLAGCSTTGVYTWFGGKHGLVEAIFIDGFERFGQALIDVRARTAPDEALNALGHAYRDWALANPTHYMVMFGRAVPGFEAGPEALVTARATFTELVDVTDEALRRQGIAGSAVDVAHHMWAGIHGYVSLQLAGMDMTRDDAEHRRRFEEGMRLLAKACFATD